MCRYISCYLIWDSPKMSSIYILRSLYHNKNQTKLDHPLQMLLGRLQVVHNKWTWEGQHKLITLNIHILAGCTLHVVLGISYLYPCRMYMPIILYLCQNIPNKINISCRKHRKWQAKTRVSTIYTLKYCIYDTFYFIFKMVLVLFSHWRLA